MKRSDAFEIGRTALDAVCLQHEIKGTVLAARVNVAQTTIVKLRQGKIRGSKALWLDILNALREFTGKSYDPNDLVDFDRLTALRRRHASL